MENYIESSHILPVIRDVDVIIVGGGPAGIAAAIASARNGAKTVIIERFGYLGGTATASLMANINGFRNQVEPDDVQTVRGIAEEIVLNLKKIDGLGVSPYPQKQYPTTPGQLEYSYAIDTEKFKFVILKMVVDAGVDILFHTWFCNSIVENDAIQGIIVENKSGRQALFGKIIVDASGDADVSYRAGVPFWQTYKDESPRMIDTLMYKIQFGKNRPAVQYACDFGNNAVVWGPSTLPINGANADELSNAEIETRLKVFGDFEEKKKHSPELVDAKIIETPPMLGIRQTRFVEGEYKLTADDAIDGKQFSDSIAVGSCPIIHFYGYRRYLEHKGFTIPYRCLVPKKIDNLLVAGRCISSCQEPYESFRAMVPIMAIGQAAGIAAAFCSSSNSIPRNLDVSVLRHLLESQGAVISV